ncbi:MAG: hypothetical protein HY737_04500 [Candidatus Omnitrophica bacterium]|nr:hypothetical protein [Candidatus Omnitrophota bacterium]
MSPHSPQDRATETREPSVFANVSPQDADSGRAPERLVQLTACFLRFGSDGIENIRQLTALAGQLLGGAYAVYFRMEGDRLYALAQWQVPPGFPWSIEAEGRVGTEEILNGCQELHVVRHLPATSYATTDPHVSLYHLKTAVSQAVKCGEACVGSLCVMFREDMLPNDEDRALFAILASAIRIEEQRRAAEQILAREQALVAQLNQITMDREDRVIELKREVNQLREQLGLEKPYRV